uniref:Uncharacterized protein n=1 Tax=Hanusia phi TaxID=3032 RepID=A0A6T7P7F5_9CRYP
MQAAGTSITSTFTRKAYNEIVGVVGSKREFGPLSLSATVDPQHRLYAEAVLSAGDNKLGIQGMTVPNSRTNNTIYNRVSMQSRVPLPNGRIDMAASAMMNVTQVEGIKPWQDYLSKKMDLALSYVHGNFTFGLSTSVDGEFSKGPNLTMSNSVTSVKYKGLGLMVTSEGSLNHIMDKVWDAVDSILIPEPLPDEDEFLGTRPKAVEEESSDSVGAMTFCSTMLSSIRPAKSDASKTPILKDVWTWTVEKNLGNAKVGALYTSEKSWAVGGGFSFPEKDFEVKGRVSNDWSLSKLHATSSLSVKLAENARLNLCSDVDLSAGSLEKILASRQFGIRLRIRNDGDSTAKETSDESPAAPVLPPPKQESERSEKPQKVEDRRDWAKLSWKDLNPMEHIAKLKPASPSPQQVSQDFNSFPSDQMDKIKSATSKGLESLKQMLQSSITQLKGT